MEDRLRITQGAWKENFYHEIFLGIVKTNRKYKVRGGFLDDGTERILKYGIACYKKQCRVMLA